MHLREPVLWRNPSELQVGTTGDRVLSGLSPDEMELILGLNRPRTPQWLAGALEEAGIAPERWDELCTALSAAPQPPESVPGTVLLLDSHPLSVTAGHLLATRGAAVVSASHGRQRTDAIRPTRSPALAILTDTWVTDPVRVGPLMRHDVPHLPVVVGDGITVGPVVVPGATACTWCLELARTDHDPCWPAVAAQLMVMEDTPVEDLELASSLVAWAVRAFLVGGATRGWRLDDDAILPVNVEPHPRCGHCVTPPSVAGPSPA